MRPYCACALVLVTAVVSCSDNTGPQLSLSQAEITQMLDALGNVGLGQGSSVGAASPTLFAAPAHGAAPPVTETVTCPQGGTANLAGTIELNASTGVGTENLTFTYSACRSGGYQFTGSLRVTGSSTSTSSSLSASSTLTGTLTIATPTGRSGNCAFNVRRNYYVNFNTGAETAIYSGTICGQSYQG